MKRALHPLTQLPPPLLFAIPLVVGIRIDAARAWPFVPANVGRPAGLALVVAAIALAFSAIGIFVRRRTTIVPHHTSRALVTSGPFRLTRNPMYVALTCAFLGICLVANTLWPLFFLGLPLMYLHAITIPREERLLRAAFGSAYDTYASRVRRWL